MNAITAMHHHAAQQGVLNSAEVFSFFFFLERVRKYQSTQKVKLEY